MHTNFGRPAAFASHAPLTASACGPPFEPLSRCADASRIPSDLHASPPLRSASPYPPSSPPYHITTIANHYHHFTPSSAAKGSERARPWGSSAMEAHARWRWLAAAVITAGVMATLVSTVDGRVASSAMPVDSGGMTEAGASPPSLPHSALLSSLERAARKGGGRSRSSRRSRRDRGRRRRGRSKRRLAPLPWSRDRSMHLGMSLAPFCDTTLTHPQLARSILSMRSAGVRHVSINVFGMQATETSTNITVGASADCAVTPRMVRWLVRRVHAAGMAVFLKPHVNLTNGRWRGEIRPSAAWFAAYRGFIWAWAKVAAEERVATFSIGVEKKLTLGHVEEWLRILRGVRARYKGSVTYCANWDSYMAVSPRMWKEYVGVWGVWGVGVLVCAWASFGETNFMDVMGGTNAAVAREGGAKEEEKMEGGRSTSFWAASSGRQGWRAPRELGAAIHTLRH